MEASAAGVALLNMPMKPRLTLDVMAYAQQQAGAGRGLLWAELLAQWASRGVRGGY